MITVTVNINAPELSDALNNLAAALTGVKANSCQPEEPKVPEAVKPEPTPEPVAPTPEPVAPTPEAADPTPAPTVPTAAPTYTMDMLATAGAGLVDAGRMQELLALLGKYGVDSLTALKQEQYGAMAADLRALGALI